MEIQVKNIDLKTKILKSVYCPDLTDEDPEIFLLFTNEDVAKIKLSALNQMISNGDVNDDNKFLLHFNLATLKIKWS
jgi:hypothetical protein